MSRMAPPPHTTRFPRSWTGGSDERLRSAETAATTVAAGTARGGGHASFIGLLREELDGLCEAFGQRDLRLPFEELPRQRDVRLADFRVVFR